MSIVFSARKRIQGLNLIEAALVLAIGAFVIAGIMYLFSTVSSANEARKNLEQSIFMRDSIRQMYTTRASFTGISEAEFYNSVPPAMQGGPGELVNASGGAISVSVNPSTDRNFNLTFAGLPIESCTKLAGFQMGSVFARVNGIPVQAINGGALDPEAVLANCALEDNTVFWRLGK